MTTIRSNRLLHLGERDTNLPDRSVDITVNELALEPEDAVAQTDKLGIATRIQIATGAVVTTIDFDHEIGTRGQKIDDELPYRHLPPKPYSEPKAANVRPEELLFGVEGRAVLPST
jgi:hypothetical protein